MSSILLIIANNIELAENCRLCNYINVLLHNTEVPGTEIRLKVCNMITFWHRQ